MSEVQAKAGLKALWLDFDLNLGMIHLWAVMTCLSASIKPSSFSITPQCVCRGVLSLCCLQWISSEYFSV